MHSKNVRPLIALLALVALMPVHGSPRQSPPGPQTTPAEIQTFEAFRAWLGQQPANVQQAGPDDVLRQYAEELRRQGKTDTEIPATSPRSAQSAIVRRSNAGTAS